MINEESGSYLICISPRTTCAREEHGGCAGPRNSSRPQQPWALRLVNGLMWWVLRARFSTEARRAVVSPCTGHTRTAG